jgi:hypothetical protein
MDHSKKTSNQDISRRRKEQPRFELKFLKSRKKAASPGKNTSRSPKDTRPRRSPAATVPPVVARSYASDIPWRDTSAVKKNRRRFDVPLNVPGAEMRLPSMPRVRIGWQIALLALLAGLAAAVYFAWNAPMFRVDEIVVEGNLRVRGSDVNAALGIQDRPIFSLNSKKLQQDLRAAFPEFSAVVVSLSLPNKVLVSILERVPVLTWYQQGGRTELVDAHGYSFPMRLENSGFVLPIVQAADLPPMPIELNFESLDALNDPLGEFDTSLVFDPLLGEEKNTSTASNGQNGMASRQILTPEMVSAILIIAQYAPEGTPLLYDAEHGLGWQDERGWQIYLGDAQDMAVKLNIYESLVKKLGQEGIEPVLISVEHTHNPYYRLEK